jgi:hypothetical protein
MFRRTTLIILLLGSLHAGAQQYGTTDFPASGDPAQRGRFIQGLVMLHNFEYDDAREVFQAVRSEDPDFVMAYWGEALTHDHPLWRQQDLAAARAVMDKLGATSEARLARAPTDRERAYIASLDVLFGDGTDEARDDAYSDALKAISERYPDDLDARALYALSILGTSYGGRDFGKYMRAGALTEEILDSAPRHPGALHYNIHSFDDPVHAPLGLRAANVYSEVAPSAVHSLHMPAHIYFGLGDYARANALNQRSFDAAANRAKVKKLQLDMQAYHSLTWLIYGRTQEGKPDESRRLIAVLESNLHRQDHATRMAFVSARGNYIVDTDKWDDALLNVNIDPQGLPPYIVATDQYVTAVARLRRGDSAGASNLLEAMVISHDPESRDPRTAAPELLRLMLQAQIDFDAGNTAQALEMMEYAVRTEQRLSPSIGPPIPVQPASELLGDLYAKLDVTDRAAQSYHLALERAVNRARTLRRLAELQ